MRGPMSVRNNVKIKDVTMIKRQARLRTPPPPTERLESHSSLTYGPTSRYVRLNCGQTDIHKK